MSGISSIGSNGAHAVTARPLAIESPQTGRLPPPEPASRVEKPMSRPQPTEQPKPHRPDVLTGPPPAFQASLLEIESNLQTVINRLEAAREHARTDQENQARREQLKPAALDTEVFSRKATGTAAPATPQDLLDPNVRPMG